MPASKFEAIGYDPNMGGLDLSGFPSLTPLHDEVDDRFAQPDRSTNGSTDLKKFIAEETAQRTPTAIVHAGGSQFKVLYRDGAWHANEVAGARRRYTDRDREALLGKLGQVAKTQSPPFRTLSKDQQLQVIRACQSGDKLGGISLYLAFSMGESRAAKYNSPIEMLHDSTLLPLLNEAAIYTWYHCNSNVVITPEWVAFRDHALGGRPITHDLLNSLWIRWQVILENESNRPAPQPQAEAPDEPEDVIGDLNEMSDEEVERAYKATVRASARSAYR